MKNKLYSLTIGTKTWDRKKAVNLTIKLKQLRLVTAVHIATLKKLDLTINDYLSNSVRVLRSAVKNEIENNRTVSIFTRKDLLEKFYRRDYRSLKSLLTDIKETVQSKRRNSKYIEDELLNKGANTVLNQFHQRMLSSLKSPKTTDNYIGIEIECVLPRWVTFETLLPFSKYINLGEDGSIRYDNNEQGKEIRVCLKQTELKTVLPQICETLQKLGAKVNKSCGLHVHLDQRNNLQVDLTYTKLVRALKLLYSVVPKSRRENGYCLRNRSINFEKARYGNRYKAINACAYSRYKTLEVRLFGGTLNSDKIINWIETLLAISNGAVINRCPKSWDHAKKYWALSEANIKWLKDRQVQFEALNLEAPVSESDAENGWVEAERSSRDARIRALIGENNV